MIADNYLPGWARNAGRAVGIFSGARTEQPMSKSFMPAATNTLTRSYYKSASAPAHPEYGAGLRIMACQFLSSTDATNGKSDGFSSGVNSIPISPDSVGGPMAFDARNYSYYAFRSLKFHFVSNMPSTDTYRQAFAYFPDSAIADFATVNFSTMQSTQDSVVTSRRQNCTLAVTPYTGSKVWFTEIDATSSASKRQTEQGILYSILNANEVTTQTTGEVLVEYVLDLYGRSPDYNFSLGFRTREAASEALRLLTENKVEICRRDRARLIRYLERSPSTNADTVPIPAISICSADGKTRCGFDNTALSVQPLETPSVDIASVGGVPLSSVYLPVNIGQVGTGNVPNANCLNVFVTDSSSGKTAEVNSSNQLRISATVPDEKRMVMKAYDSTLGEQNPGTGPIRQPQHDVKLSRVDEEYVRVPPSTPQGPPSRLERKGTR